MQSEIEASIAAALDAQRVLVMIDGNRATIEVVSAQFEGMNRVQRQQAVYACIGDYITDGRLHAVTIKADTPI